MNAPSMLDGYIVVEMTTRPPKRLHTLNIRLDDATLTELREIAAVESRSLSNLVQKALRDWLAWRRAASDGSPIEKS